LAQGTTDFGCIMVADRVSVGIAGRIGDPLPTHCGYLVIGSQGETMIRRRHPDEETGGQILLWRCRQSCNLVVGEGHRAHARPAKAKVIVRD
jgi:hypothetical protein